MLGAFDGRVVDADSKEPIDNALVWCSWAFVRGVGDAAPEAVRTAEARTNADGRYRLPRLASFPSGLSTRLARFSLVIYRKGYVAYRQDRVFGRAGARRDFSQVSNTVKLVRWSPELSHAEHLLFVGSGPALAQASDWEATTAARQLDEGPGARRPALGQLGAALADLPAPTPGLASPPLEASDLAQRLLTSDDVRGVTGFSGAFTRTRLRSSGDATDTLHLRAVERPERYDVAIRFWRLSSAALTGRYETLLGALPGSKQTDELGDRSFTVTQGEILALGFISKDQDALVLLTCGKGQCTKPEHLTQLAKAVEKNLRSLPARETR